jgi:N6-adenosine-specific RNA methylase IME4
MKKYKTILIDPPYYEAGGGKIKRGADRHYKLMKTKEIIILLKEILKDKVDENAHLYLWVTNNFLKDGLKIIEELGFRYITNIVWVKDRFGLGQYFRGQHELLLFAVKGKLPALVRSQTTVLHEKRTKHSKKPYGSYNKIEAVSPPPRLEIFARERREGWDVFGDEIPNYTQLTLK